MGKKLIVNVGGTAYTVQMDDSKMAEEFASLAPFETSVSEYAGNHYWGSTPSKIAMDEKYQTSTPIKGGLYYADHTTALAVFYEKSGSIAPYKIYHIGDVVEDMSEMKRLPSSVKCTVKVMED